MGIEKNDITDSEEFHAHFINLISKQNNFPHELSFELLNQKNWMQLYPLQPFPVLLNQSTIHQLSTISEMIVKVIKEIPAKFFHNNPVEIAKFYHLMGGESWAEILLDQPSGIDAAIYRPDLIFTEKGIQCIEVNGGNPGGWIVSSLIPLYKDNLLIQRYLLENNYQLNDVNTVQSFFLHIIHNLSTNYHLTQVEQLNIAITVSTDYLKEFNPVSMRILQQEYSDTLHKIAPHLTGQVFICHYDELNIHNSEVILNNNKIHALIEDFVMDCSNRMKVFRAHKRKVIDLYSGPITLILNDKRNLVLLSDNMQLNYLSEDERALLDAAIPWTRLVALGNTTYKNENILLNEFIFLHKDLLVLKHANSHGGQQVYLGKTCSQRIWDEIVNEALKDQNWIVQEYIQSQSYDLLSRTGDIAKQDVVWGPFIIADKYAGGFARVLSQNGYTANNDSKNHAFLTNAMINSQNADANVTFFPMLSLKSLNADD